MNKTLVQKLNDELRKLGLECKLVKELSEHFRVNVFENGLVVLENQSVPKVLQWNKVNNYAKNIKDMVEMKKALGWVK